MSKLLPAFVCRVLEQHNFISTDNGSMECVKPLKHMPYLLEHLPEGEHALTAKVHVVVSPTMEVSVFIADSNYSEHNGKLGKNIAAEGLLLEAGVPAFGVDLLKASIVASGGKTIPEEGPMGASATYYVSLFKTTPSGHCGIATFSWTIGKKCKQQVVFASLLADKAPELTSTVPKISSLDSLNQLTEHLNNFKLLLSYLPANHS